MSTHDAVIAGIGQTNYRRSHGLPLGRLIGQAATDAMADAGVVPGDIDTVFTESSTSPSSFPIDRFTSTFGLHNVVHHGCFGVGGSGLFYAVLQATQRIRAGMSGAAIVYFGLDWGSRPTGPYSFHERFPAKLAWEVPYGFYGQATYYAAMARRYQIEHGLSDRDLKLGLGEFAVSSRQNALLNPTSQTTKPLDLAVYDDARPIATPFCVYDCCLVSDGAAAVVLTRASRATPRGVAVVAGAYRQENTSEEDFFSQSPGYFRLPAAREASRAAYAMAGIRGPEDAQFMNVYDCFTMSALLQLEAIGWCEPGRAVFDVRGGVTSVKGARPVNTHGGLLSNGYILGFNHLVEAVRQLRGEAGAGQVPDARLGIVSAAPARHHTTLVLART
jgi:acetyl-CoA acetyltransferase